MNQEQLESQLKELRLKWIDFPKSSMDKRWWAFNCDKLKATRIKTEIEKIKKFEAELLEKPED